MKALTCTLVAILVTTWPLPAGVALGISMDDLLAVGSPLVSEAGAPGPLGVGVYLGEEPGTAGLTPIHRDGGSLSDVPSLGHFSVPAPSPDEIEGGEGVTSAAEPGTLALVLLTLLAAGAVTLARRRGPAPLRHR